MAPRVAALTVYPIKACGGVPVDRSTVTPTGLANDRSFLVVGPDNRARTQRRSPLLATVRPALDGDRLVLTAPGVEPLRVDVRRDGPRSRVTIFGWEHPALDQGDDAADWFSTLLRVPSRLVGLAPEHHRPTDGLVPGLTGWADSGSVLLLSRDAADDLSDRVAARTGEPLPLDRFRTNVLITGCPAHAEDGYDRIALGTARLAFAKLAVRCKVVTVDQDDGRVEGTEPLDTLATYRATDDGVVFGAKYTVLEPGEVIVGDALASR